MSRGINYKDYFVAFLDILGFKNLVDNKTANEIHRMFSKVVQVKEIIKGKPYERSPFKNIQNYTSLVFFSDSIICAIPSDIPDAFLALTSHCMMIQHVFWMEKNPIWVRGAIAKGPLYCKDNVVFGPSLIEAYRTEETLAKYPRIIMTQSTYEDGIENLTDHEDVPYVSNTMDGFKMIDSLRHFAFPELKNVREQIEDIIRKETNISVREKYLWIKEHYNSCVDKNSKYKPFRTPLE